MSQEPIHATKMHERFLLRGTSHEFVLQWDWTVDVLSANELLIRERECPKSPLTDQQAEAILTLMSSGV